MFGKKKIQNTSYDAEILGYYNQRKKLRDKLVATTQQAIVSKGIVDLLPENTSQRDSAHHMQMVTKKKLAKMMEDYDAVRERYNALIVETLEERNSTILYTSCRETAQEVVCWAYRDFYRK